MLEITWIVLIGAVLFYILRVLFSSQEFNVLSLILSVCAMATVLTDADILGDQLVFYVIPIFYLIAMGVIHFGFGNDRWSI